MYKISLLQWIGVISIGVVLLQALYLLIFGGTVMVMPPTPATTIREPVFRAFIPLCFGLLALIGLIKGQLTYLWIGGFALVVTGFLFIFSLGIHIALVGVIVLLIAFSLGRKRSNRQHHG